MAFDNDEDFDWAAAVAEIDKACSQFGATSVDNGGAESSGTQSRAYHQKTLDSFVRGGVKQRSNVANIQAENGDPRALGSYVGNQRPTGTDCRTQHASIGRGEDTASGCYLPLDRDAAKIWIYPANVPRRSYQFDITKSALFCNTLVCLPTGLGKTLIAAVVIYNYFRWFPTGKIVFTAPSRPLVVQQIEACHMVTGIPQDMTIDMTGQMNPQLRAEHWQSKRVFFVTPQVLEKDIQAGRCATKQIVCLVVDEAHRASGNYSYCVVVRELLAAKVEPRILALTATPGSNKDTIQAVVDNLKISHLEYRDEHDPDVSQYTHNREIELIEVAMNAESIQVKDVFIEVLQPIVQRLCYLGVFYNREIARLTPYEFLTAREKFRQAPPRTLQESRYPEVETYFGLAITLAHIFKLLNTHGMRPAFEMLRQKLEQGPLKRLAKNEKLCQVQDLMKQSIGHGAPSPKLEKVVDIINGHFSVHDATKTRVIIFTNYRESVKDIMEKLAASCGCVKAMEFIGQSSGKSSKGQTQKTQQAVLQRFRGGCYNTIVATSIGEEGLDIMEVDLVICFDANVSPLRMIQRMGRTGRKRDGRVVVLASGGSEIQGYLKKKSKSKVLGKHMLNGGLQSFNFHPSHHMIPHSLRTTVQFVELTIEDFVHRGRKLKEKDAGAAAGRHRKLTERELGILKLFKDLPCLESEIKSKHLTKELYVGPVYQVKHSKRSCILMDVRQTLRLPLHENGEEQLSREKVTPGVIKVPVKSNSPLAVDELCLPTSPPCAQANTERDNCGPRLDQQDLECITTGYVLPSSSISRPTFEQSTCIQAGVKDSPLWKETMSERHHEVVVPMRPISSSAQNYLERTGKSAVCPIHIEDEDFHKLKSPPLIPTTHKDFSVDHKMSGDGKTKVDAQGEHKDQSSFLTLDEPDLNHYETPDQHHGTGFHRCRFSTGVVSVTQSGLVLIASPPSLLLSKKITTKGSMKPTGQSNNFSTRRTASCSILEQTIECIDPSMSENHIHAAVTPDHNVAGAHRSIDFVAATPYEKVVHSSPNEDRQWKAAIQTTGLGLEELSPRLAELAKDGIVPSTPVMDVQSVCGKGSVLPVVETVNCAHLPSSGQMDISPIPTGKDIQCQSTSVQNNISLKKPTGPAIFGFAAGMSPPRPRNLDFGSARSLGSDGLDNGRRPPRDQPIPGDCNRNRSSNPEEGLQTSGENCITQYRSPVQILSCKSSREDWQMNGDEPMGSVQRPRKLKRLCRAREKLPASTPKTSSKRFQKCSAQDQVRSKVHHPRSGRDEKHQRTLAARAFIDEEAEVSSDDEVDDSSEMDDSEDVDDNLSEGFIDTAATQHLNGSLDMMEVYRKSLLTPSPLGSVGGKWMKVQQQHTTPSSDGTASSIEPSPASASLEDTTPGYEPSHSVDISLLCAQPQNTVQKTPICDPQMNTASNGGKCWDAITTNAALGGKVEVLKDQGNPEIRKRKLNFKVSSSFEDDLFVGDDLFEGVDLDALEAEATKLSRLRTQGEGTSKEGFQKQSMLCSGASRAQESRSGACSVSPSPRLRHNNEFEFFPSFDLGLDD